MLLSERVYYGCHIQNDSEYSNGSASNFAWSLNIPLQKQFGWSKRLQLWPTGDWQLHHGNTPLMHNVSCRDFWQNIESPWWLSTPYSPDWCPVTSGFSQNKNHFWTGRDSDHPWDSGKYNRAADGSWENCVRSQGAYFEGDWGVIILWTMFLVSCISSNCLYFS